DAAVPFAFGAVPKGAIALERQKLGRKLLLGGADFLKTDNLCLALGEPADEALGRGRADAVDVEGEQSHRSVIFFGGRVAPGAAPAAAFHSAAAKALRPLLPPPGGWTARAAIRG